MTWINIIITLISALLSSGIVGGIAFYRFNQKLKALEVKDSEIEVIKKQDDEWQALYFEAKERIRSISDISQQLREENNALKQQNGELKLRTQQLTWYRCTINNCPNRKPPHVFDKDGNELELCS